MSRIKRQLISSSNIGRRGWTCWRKIAPGTNQEIGISFGLLGMIEIGRYFFKEHSRGTVQFEAGGTCWYWTFSPCPSCLGLARIARRLRLDVERLNDARCMLRANGSFMGEKRRAEFARGLAIMERKLKGPK